MRLKSWVVNTIIVLAIFIVCSLTVYVASSLVMDARVDNNSYVLRDLLDEDVMPVMKVDEEEKISKPFEAEDVSVMTDYYRYDASAEEQEKSLILYQNTYMPSTGILYGSDKSFDVRNVYAGKVTNITENEAFGTVVEITHENDLVSKYSSLKDVSVKIGDMVSNGDVIGKSGNNKVISTCQNMLFFELVYKGESVSPNKYYDTDLSE